MIPLKKLISFDPNECVFDSKSDTQAHTLAVLRIKLCNYTEFLIGIMLAITETNYTGG